jgi:hypothetical protein
MVIFNPISGPGPNARWVTGVNAFTRDDAEHTSFILAPAFDNRESTLTNPGSVQIKIPVIAAMRLVSACRAAKAALDLRPESLRQQYARGEGVFAQAEPGILNTGVASYGHGYDGKCPGFH